MSNNCLSVLQTYGDFLSNNPGEKTNLSPMPHPLMFSAINCSGTTWPAFEVYPEYKNPVAPALPTGQFGSLYVPPYWTVILKGNNNESKQICASDQPLLISDASNFFFDTQPVAKCSSTQKYNPADNIPTLNSVTTISMQAQVPGNPEMDYPQSKWIFNMCNNVITTTIGSRLINSYYAGSSECDDFMETYCSEDTNLATKPECACVRDEIELETKFCQPGNSVPACQSQNLLQQFLPVTCFGQNCSSEGYRFSKMRDQKCNITLCQQILTVIGNNIVVEADTILYCGTKSLQGVSPSPIEPSSDTTTDLPSWVWVLIIVGIFVLFILLPLSVIVFRRNMKLQTTATNSKRSEIQSGIQSLGVKNFLGLSQS